MDEGVRSSATATAEIVRDTWNGHSGSLNVVPCCASRRDIWLAKN